MKPIPKAGSAGYRPEIEGIRAVASLLVACFHIWLGRVSGGVDVFFVIAGFLTTVTLLGHVRRYGRVHTGKFLTRLASRLFPASAVVLAVVAAASVLLLLPSQWKQTFTEIFASAVYLENWQLDRSGLDYLSQDDFHSPVQNFWAMSLQGQFYLLWAVLFLVATLLTAYGWKRSYMAVVTVLLVVVVAASFSYSLYAVAQDQPSAYYNTAARAWEFGLGGLAAVVLPRLTIAAPMRLVAGWTGLIGMLSCGLILQVSTAFPGVAALWPTVSALLILVAGTGIRSRYGAERLLGSRPLVWVGGISYGIYLWHWPILVFWNETTGTRPTVFVGLGIILAAVGLAWLTKRYVEDPLHNRAAAEPVPRNRLRPLVPFAMLTVAALAGGVGFTGVTLATKADAAEAHALVDDSKSCFGAAAMDNREACPGTIEWSTSVPRLDPSADTSPIDTRRCSTTTVAVELKECVFGRKGSDTRVVLIGNSHAASFFSAFERVAEKRGWELHVFFKTGCVFTTASRRDDSDVSRETCRIWNGKLQRELAEQEPYAFALTAYSAKKSVFLDDEKNPSEQAGIDGFRESWQPLIDRGTQLIAVHDNPVLETIDQLKCAERPGTAETCSIPLEDAFGPRDLMVEAATDWPGALAVDLTPQFCNEQGCPLVIGGVKVYRDRGHITATYSKTLAPFLEDGIERARKR